MTTPAPLSFIKKIEENITITQQIPLWGECPCFPWEALCSRLQKEIEDPHFRLAPVAHEAVAPENFLSDFGENPKCFSFQLSPLQGTITWVISAESLAQISSLILNGPEIKQPSDLRFQEGFYQFFLLQITQHIEELKAYPDLHIQWVKNVELPKKPAFTIDISITLKERSFLGRLIIPEECREAFCSHFVRKSFNPLSSPVSAKIDIPLNLSIGSCEISQEEWKTIRTGDLLILDHCSYDPITQKGTATLSWDETPCFKIKIKKSNIKIIDYAVYNGEPNHG